MKAIFILVFIIFISVDFVDGQNIFDATHSYQFANYLFQTKQYKLAAQEFERVVFLDSGNNNAKLFLLKSYRLSEDYENGLLKINHLFPDSIPPPFSDEYLKLAILNKDYNLSFKLLNTEKFTEAINQNNYIIANYIMDKKPQLAMNFALKNPPDGTLKNAQFMILANDIANIRYKKPVLASAMSAIVPGSGKIYCKNWKDGLISLLFVAANSWQAYRGFSKNGNQSVYGWIYGTFATGFYLGNIYGSYKEAVKYNQIIENEMVNKASLLLFADF